MNSIECKNLVSVVPIDSKLVPYSDSRYNYSTVTKLGIALKINHFEKFSKNVCYEIIERAVANLKNRINKKKLPEQEKLKAVNILENLENESKNKVKGEVYGAKISYIADRIANKLASRYFLLNPEANKQKKFELTLKEREVFRFATNKPLYCHDYAFYMLNEVNVILERFTLKDGSENIFNKLKERNYECQTNPKPGDLVLYFKNKANKENVTHLGIWTSDGKVRSKFGTTYVYDHPLDYVPEVYGNYARFLRNKVPAAFAKYCLKELEGAKESVQNFDHKATHSPLTNYGAAYALRSVFKKENIYDVFLKSIYNVEYNQLLKDLILYKINTIAVGLHLTQDIHDKQAVFLNVQNIIMEALSEIKPNI